MTITAPLELRFGHLTWIESAKAGDSAWFSHWRQYRLRARPLTPTRWVVSHETPGGWMLIGNTPSFGDVSALAEKWVMK